ncbi:MAG: M23 family metallopeptidase [Ignavibacteriaceae bacterium]|nr:M23 family metallopeptidase [Ignavibacteriaceae bacterium]
MKKLYYFSKSKLQFVEIKKYKLKLTVTFSVAVLTISVLIFGGYHFILSLTASNKDIYALKSENKALVNKLDEVIKLYKNLDQELDSLKLVDDDLRVAANLPPISDEERKVGIGGSSFDNILDFSKYSTPKLDEALAFIDEISRKVEFEKSNYANLSKTLEKNRELSEAIPAIIPCTGTIGTHGFGMRMHPILHIKRMHDGIDIITDRGTPVYAPGKGKVLSVGYRGGYGLCIEIDHGFGYHTVYGHLSSTNVKEGESVLRGRLIAKSGSSGLSSGPHLHYEVHHDGVKLDPEHFFFDKMGFFELTRK